MPMLPSPTASTRYVFSAISASSDPHHVSGTRRFLRRERRLERRHGVLGRADRGLPPGERAIGGIQNLLAHRPAAFALVHRPIGRVGTVELFAIGDSEIGERVLDL